MIVDFINRLTIKTLILQESRPSFIGPIKNLERIPQKEEETTQNWTLQQNLIKSSLSANALLTHPKMDKKETPKHGH